MKYNFLYYTLLILILLHKIWPVYEFPLVIISIFICYYSFLDFLWCHPNCVVNKKVPGITEITMLGKTYYKLRFCANIILIVFILVEIF